MGRVWMVVAVQFEQFTKYWKSLQAVATGDLPVWSQFSPGKITALLPYVYILEHRSPEEMHVRLIGTSLDEVSGVAITGMNYLDVCPPQDAPVYKEVTKHVFARPCASLLVRDVMFESGKTYTLSSLGFPMNNTEGKPQITLGLMLPSRQFKSDDSNNGGVASSVLRSLSYIDIGFGVPDIQDAEHEAIKAVLT